MEPYSKWSAPSILEHHRKLEILVARLHDPQETADLALTTAELDRRCNEVFEWEGDQLHVKPQNPFITVHQTIEEILNEWQFPIGARPCIFFYPIFAPAEFSALLSYFISKPRT
jgi:hypothetical protein